MLQRRSLLQFYPQIRRGGGISETTQDADDIDDTSDSDSDTSDDDSSDKGSSSSESGDVSASDISGYWCDYYEEFSISSDSTNYIRTAEQLAYLAYMVNSGSTYEGYVFQLTADIDLSDHYWVPIGGHEADNSAYNSAYYFMGEFDGNGHEISGLTIYDTSTSTGRYSGLFGYIGGSSNLTTSVHDVGVVECDIYNYRSNCAGAVAGQTAGYVYVYNCYSSGTIYGGVYVGGIVGWATGHSQIYNCYNTCSIDGYRNYIGGIAGELQNDVYVHDCYNIGSISTSTGAYVGGIVGRVYTGSGETASYVYNCYNVADVSASIDVGGIVGYFYQPTGGIWNCFSIGNITATYTGTGYELVGGIVGECYSKYFTLVYSCYYYGIITLGDETEEVMGVGGYPDSVGLTDTTYSFDLETLAKDESWFTDSSNWDETYPWDFDETWVIFEDCNEGYPIFTENTSNYWYLYYTSFTISSSSKNEISTAEQLAYLAYMVNSGNTYSGYVFQLTADIDLSAHYWVPIGGHEYDNSASSTSTYFAGEFDGNGHVVTGLKTYNDGTKNSNYMGLFGRVVGALSATTPSIHDLGIENCSISGYAYVGAVLGSSNYSVNIYNCYNTGSVTGSLNGIGGIIGYATTDAYIYNCYNTGSVTSSSYGVGGIAGYATAYSTSPSYVYNCYNTGSVTGLYYVGGVVGTLGNSSNCLGYVYNSFNVGNVTATSTDSTYYQYAGGVVGNLLSGSVSYCYYNCSITGNGNTYSWGIGNTTDEDEATECLSNLKSLAKSESWFTTYSNWNSDYPWNFLLTWRIDENENDGYPILQAKITYNSDWDYWYYEDGEFPQSEVTDSDLITVLDSSGYDTGETYEINAETFSVYAYKGEKYIKVMENGKNSSSKSSDGTWFLIEPIRWIVAYGEDKPSSFSTAVSALVLATGSYKTTSPSDFSFTSLYNATKTNSAVAVSSGMLQYSLVGSVVYDMFNTASASQDYVYSVNLGNKTDDNTVVTSAGYRVASVSEIDALGGTYKASCSDLVAFLLTCSGTSTSGGTAVDYWTRDLAYYLSETDYYLGYYNSGVYVGADGLISNAWLSETMGARLSVKIG